ncbi:hypothetical protein [Streptomyces sp. SM12]|uniref:hypothetical protein n=1 Tax=Streptomyces sp. SM12 TaxID=1071602 RepID=UPI000CD50714|nr:hypothetical protein [Streptomyces sp. SM12]
MSTSYAAVISRAAAWGVLAANTNLAVGRMEARFQDRVDSATYLGEAMAVLDVDTPTTAAYLEIGSRSQRLADHVGTVVSESDALQVVAQGLGDTTQSQHGRMKDLNATHHVPMANRRFIERR